MERFYFILFFYYYFFFNSHFGDFGQKTIASFLRQFAQMNYIPLIYLAVMVELRRRSQVSRDMEQMAPAATDVKEDVLEEDADAGPTLSS